jgi:hypothetical protein
MRIVETWDYPLFKVVIFSYENHFYLEIEAGPMKQCLKIPKDSVGGNLEGVRKVFTPVFIDSLVQRFHSLHADFSKALKDASL